LKQSLAGGLALALLAGSATSVWAAPEVAWDPVNAPTRLDPGFSPYFDETGLRVPMTAHVPNSAMPYADTYWPSNRGGIAYRWNQGPWINPYLVDMAMHYPRFLPAPSEQARMDSAALEILRELEQLSPAQRAALVQAANAPFHYHSPSRDEARQMSRAELAQLSPTEKYDLFRGQYDYPMTRDVLTAKNVGPMRSYWEGICHGWAPASVNHSEPLPVDVVNPDGVVIPFGSADVKALLDYMYTSPERGFFGLHVGNNASAVTQMGYRCNTDLTVNPNGGGIKCQGVNAGAFHIAMTNYIGLRHKPFVADVGHGKEIWNNPVYAYSFQVIDHSCPATVAAGTRRCVKLHTVIRYPSDDERFGPQWDPTIGREEVLVPDNEAPVTGDLAARIAVGYRYEEGKYDYWLELGEGDRILGGTWASQDRLDYLWNMTRKPFTGEFEDLARIYRPAFEQ
jgi:hypothetical protein